MSEARSSEDRAQAVAAFLRAHPNFLADRPDLYRTLTPPRRVHGEVLADHMAAMIAAERVHAAAMATRADDVLAAGRAAAGLVQRVQAAVLALIRARDPAECVIAEFPALLAVDSATLRTEGEGIPRGGVAMLLGKRDAALRAGPEDAGMLHGEASGLASVDALVRVPGDPPMLLCLAAREPGALDPAQGSAALVFLGRAVAAALGR
jgi:uncharacterized protein YigA (DUF484 family)